MPERPYPANAQSVLVCSSFVSLIPHAGLLRRIVGNLKSFEPLYWLVSIRDLITAVAMRSFRRGREENNFMPAFKSGDYFSPFQP